MFYFFQFFKNIKYLLSRTLFLFFLLIPFLPFFSQTYVLNEDFASANGTTPPTGWSNVHVSDSTKDIWHFDNPGNRVLDFPIIGTFAIFDSENYSNDSQVEKSYLETGEIDCSVSPNIILLFDHQLIIETGNFAEIEVFDGTSWTVVKTISDSTNGIESQFIDVSQWIGNTSDAKIRFTWNGNGKSFWAIDNIQVFAPLSNDASISLIQAPQMTFSQGIYPIEVQMLNYGISTITNVTIAWSVNGILQTPFNWTGNLPSGGVDNNINIGSYNFISGITNIFKVWVENPNGIADVNALNDTATNNLIASLCGSYTVGGINPDFANFTEVANALNNVGITCPVTFVVRDGVYEEQINIVNVPGNSLVNTVTFLGESGDSSLVTLSYSDANNILDYTLNLENTYGFTFRDIGFSRGNNSYVIKATNSNSLKIVRCHFHSDYKSLLFETGTDIHFSNSYFTRNHFYLSDSIYGFSLEHNVGLGHFELVGDWSNNMPSYVDSLYIYGNTFSHNS